MTLRKGMYIYLSLPQAFYYKFLFSLALCLGFTGGAKVVSAQAIHGLDDKKVEISLVSSFLDSVPNRGSVTLDFRVRNHLSQPAQWTFSFEVTEGWNKTKTLLAERSLRVDVKTAKTVRWEIPVIPSNETRNSQSQRLTLRVSGPGAGGNEQNLLNSSGNYYGGNDTRSIVAVSPYVSTSRSAWNYQTFKDAAEENQSRIQLVEFDSDATPSDLQAFSGVDIFLMSEDEWNTISREHPLFTTWVAAGGQIVLLGDSTTQDSQLGAGRISGIADENEKDVVSSLKKLTTFTKQLSDDNSFNRKEWKLAEAIPEIKTSFGLMMLMVIAIAALVGPINIWLSFRRKNSLQVIWSTPLISLGVSVLIGLGIVFSDGFGGKGQRAQWVLLLPEQGVEVTLQEQISRTGVLLRNSFSLAEGTEIYQVPSEIDRTSRHIQFEQLPNGDWTGDWFENRSIQAQVFRRSRTSRSTIKWIDGSLPSILSTVDAEFNRLFVRTVDGRTWIAEAVLPGETHGMRLATTDETDKFLDELKTRERFQFSGQNLLNRKGWFFAETLDDDRYIESLSSIRWNDRPIWFMGPLEMEEQP